VSRPNLRIRQSTNSRLSSAIANGFSYTNSHAWANLGQGAPEVGPIPGAHPRPDNIPMPLDSLEYAPTTGVKGQ